MTNDQARKLLGGYATNSLTEAERKALFEAALDDQELFNSLQQEEALKELLADPISRNQIQQALAEPPDARAAAAWWSRRWFWGGIAGAVAATVMMIAVIRSNDRLPSQVAQVAPAPPAATEPEPTPSSLQPPAEPKPQPRARTERPAKPPAVAKAVTGSLRDSDIQEKAQAAAAPPPPPPPPPTPTPAAAPTPRMQALRSAPMAGAVNRMEAARGAAGVAGLASNFQGAANLRYSLLKRDPLGAFAASPTGAASQRGDALRLNVFSAIAGYLSLEQLDSAGVWTRLFPATDRGLLVAPNTTEAIPDSPIIVTATEQKFRLKLVPADGTDSAALTVDIVIGPGQP